VLLRADTLYSYDVEGDMEAYTPKGCKRCGFSGYKGRVGLYEVMEITEELRELILVGASALELRRKAIDEGMITLRHSGLRKVKDGVTTVDEVVRETVK
jgi:type IV pilus assembly protein PilB